MGARSSYLQYLPPVLWADEDADAAFSLAGMLRIFEKMLTGIDDGVPAAPALAAEVAAVPRVLDPWTTPKSFLPWLAGWVDLELPTLQGTAVWDEHQQRQVIAKIVATYRQRGQRAGISRFLELCAVGDLRPRIGFDDGSRVLVTVPGPNGPAPVAALVTQGPVVNPAVPAAQAILADGLLQPSCIAVGAGGRLFLGDRGALDTGAVPLRSRIWRLGADGSYDLAGAPPKPQPFVSTGLSTREVVALAVRPARTGQPETLFALDSFGRVSSMPTSTPGAQLTTFVELGLPFSGVGMGVDAADDLVVLDAGGGAGSPNPARVLQITVATKAVASHPLQSVVAAQSLLVDADGTLLIGDGRGQDAPDAETIPANIVHVERGQTEWVENDLLPADRARNPLVAPTALARGDGGELYVLDAGLKPFVPTSDPFVVTVARPTAIYRIDVGGDPAVRLACEPSRFVYPTGMVARAGRLVVCDPGQPFYPSGPARWARLLPAMFEVVVHFTEARLPDEDAARTAVLTRANLTIRAMVDEQKPAHTVWTSITTS